jgi:hypothetical protein
VSPALRDQAVSVMLNRSGLWWHGLEDARYQHPTNASHRSRRSRRLGLLDFRYRHQTDSLAHIAELRCRG